MRSQPSLDYYRELFRVRRGDAGPASPARAGHRQRCAASPPPPAASWWPAATWRSAPMTPVSPCRASTSVCSAPRRRWPSAATYRPSAPSTCWSPDDSSTRPRPLTGDWSTTRCPQTNWMRAWLNSPPRSCPSPAAIRHGKRMFCSEMALADADYAGDVMARNMMDEDAAEGIDAFLQSARRAAPERPPGGSGQPASAQPPAAVITTHTGDQRAYTSRPNNNRASPSPPVPAQAEQQQGQPEVRRSTDGGRPYRVVQADSSIADHGGVHAGQHVAHPRRRSPSQIAPASSKAPGRKIIASMLKPLIQPIQPPAVAQPRPKTRQRRTRAPAWPAPRHSPPGNRLRHHAAGHRRGFQHGQHHMPATENRAGPVASCAARGWRLSARTASRSTGPRTVPAAPIRAAPHADGCPSKGRGGSCKPPPTTAPRRWRPAAPAPRARPG